MKRGRVRKTKHVPHSESISRPVRRIGEVQARIELARDTCRSIWGVDEQRASRMLHLPLMDVALDGVDGIAIAQAREQRLAA